jgi:hypothetical protein
MAEHVRMLIPQRRPRGTAPTDYRITSRSSSTGSSSADSERADRRSFPRLRRDGTPLSDHELLAVSVRLARPTT